MRALLCAGIIALISSRALAQTPGSTPAPPPRSQSGATVAAGLATAAGHEVNVNVGSYNYTEPGDLSISIHGPKFGGEYTGTMLLSPHQHLFAQANVRGTAGPASYDGWCSPFVITPNSASPNGYELGEGDASACSETGDSDWYLEARALVGKDFIGQTLAASPYAGLGYRHLSNGTAGINGYRTDEYLTVPLGLTVRARMASHSVLSFNLEYDPLVRGWQKTRDSRFGSGDIPATPTAPAFSIDGFSDVSFSQHGGRAVRASAKYQLNSEWSVEPYYVRWNVSASPANFETTTFTVNGVTAQEQSGFYEPRNVTNEFGVKLGFHFGGRTPRR